MTYFLGRMDKKHMSAFALYKTLPTQVSSPAKKARLQVNVRRVRMESGKSRHFCPAVETATFSSSKCPLDNKQPHSCYYYDEFVYLFVCLFCVLTSCSLQLCCLISPTPCPLLQCYRYQIKRRRKRKRRMGPLRLTHLKPSQRVKRESWQRRHWSLQKERTAMREEHQWEHVRCKVKSHWGTMSFNMWRILQPDCYYYLPPFFSERREGVP